LSGTGSGNATFVGFGFGPIQAGLFCFEAVQSGAFRHLVIAEIVPEVVAEVRAAGGTYTVNLAHTDHVEAVTVGPVQMENPESYADRARLIEAIAAAQEIATAVPNVRAYRRTGQGSLHRILAQGFQRKVAVAGPRAVIYAAENHPHAAALLRGAVMEEVPEAERAAVGRYASFVDTVIPKMSGVISPPDDLAPLTPASDRALLVEAFNKIMVGQAEFIPGFGLNFDSNEGESGVAFTSGFPTFVVKEELTPFEEAKFLGHNGIHALGAYLGMAAGQRCISEWQTGPGMMSFLRAAFVDEVGVGLIHRYVGADDLFTAECFAAFADDLLVRTVNPYLRDTIERVGRDPERKLGWDDRLIGAMRVAHAAGVTPWRFAMGAAAALHALDPAAEPAVLLPALWRQADPAPDEAATMLAFVQQGMQCFKAWRAAAFPDLAASFDGWWTQAAIEPST
jgi:mannitol-1-phosphate 5-dehydrogenase